MLPGQQQRVLGVARRVVGREVQRLEVVEIALHLRAQRGRVAQVMKHRDDLVHRLQQRVLNPRRTHRTRQRDIDRRLHRPRRRDSLSLRQRRFNLLLQLVEANAQRLARLGRGGLKPRVADQLQPALFAAQPAQAKRFRIHAVHRLAANFRGQRSEGGVQGGLVVVGKLGDVFVHEYAANAYTVSVSRLTAPTAQ